MPDTLQRAWIVIVLAATLLATGTMATADDAVPEIDADTMSTELAAHRDVFELITGRTPRNGREWWEHELAQSGTALGANPDNATALQTRAEALVRLGSGDAADALARLAEVPDVDPTVVTRLRVDLHAANGEFAAARELLASLPEPADADAAMRQKLEMALLVWHAAPDAALAATNMVGKPRTDYPAVGDSPVTDVEFTGLLLLVRRLPHAPEPMLLLSDALFGRGHLNLALYAALRARQLAHPAAGEIDRRIDAVFAIWQATANAHDWRVVEDRAVALTKMERELTYAADWMKKAHAMQGELLAAGRPATDFTDIEHRLDKLGHKKRWPRDHGLRDTWPGFYGTMVTAILWGLSFAFMATLTILLWRKRRQSLVEQLSRANRPAAG